MTFQIVPTDDGSVSCRDSETGQLCHNSAGAYTEAVQNYVLPSRLLEKARNADQIRVLDACYGMGYNSWALINELVKQDSALGVTRSKPLTLSIVAIEKHPKVVRFLPQVLEHPTFDALKEKIPPSEHNIYYRTLMNHLDTKGDESKSLPFTLNVADWLQVELTLWIDDIRSRLSKPVGNFDAIFHDPFSPQKMPELWSADLFKHYCGFLSANQGALLTYSTAAAIRGGLREAGFQVLKTRGLGKKAGGTLALPTASARALYQDQTIPLEPWEEEYLGSRAGIPYRDRDLAQDRAVILSQRQAEQEQSARPSGAAALKKKPRHEDSL